MAWEQELAVAKKLALQAADRVLEIYHGDFTYENKDDGTPVTQADLASTEIIVSGLKEAFPDDVVLIEELEDDKKRLSHDRVWIVDPIDGTKEFISKNGEFTVNIALTVSGDPVVGVVGVPAKNTMYFAAAGEGAFVETNEGTSRIQPSTISDAKEMRLVVSRSHLTEKDQEFIDAGIFKETVPVGSAIKGCFVASGQAEVYCRPTGQNEWDTCAMDLVVRESGAKMTKLDGSLVEYNKDVALTGGFLVSNGVIHEKLLDLFK